MSHAPVASFGNGPVFVFRMTCDAPCPINTVKIARILKSCQHEIFAADAEFVSSSSQTLQTVCGSCVRTAQCFFGNEGSTACWPSLNTKEKKEEDLSRPVFCETVCDTFVWLLRLPEPTGT